MTGTDKLIMAAICFGIPCISAVVITLLCLRYNERRHRSGWGPRDRDM